MLTIRSHKWFRQTLRQRQVVTLYFSRSHWWWLSMVCRKQNTSESFMSSVNPRMTTWTEKKSSQPPIQCENEEFMRYISFKFRSVIGFDWHVDFVVSGLEGTATEIHVVKCTCNNGLVPYNFNILRCESLISWHRCLALWRADCLIWIKTLLMDISILLFHIKLQMMP